MHLLSASQRQPNSLAVLTALARAYEAAGDDAEALDVYRKINSLRPELNSVMNNYAWLLAKNPATLDQALEFAQKAVKEHPLKPEIQDTMGWIYYQKKDYEKALQHLERAALFDPLNPTIRYHRGMSYYKMGRKSEAEKDFTIADSFSNFPEKSLNQEMVRQINL
jgi:Tfp pilus assembly protein PilF